MARSGRSFPFSNRTLAFWDRGIKFVTDSGTVTATVSAPDEPALRAIHAENFESYDPANYVVTGSPQITASAAFSGSLGFRVNQPAVSGAVKIVRNVAFGSGGVYAAAVRFRVTQSQASANTILEISDNVATWSGFLRISGTTIGFAFFDLLTAGDLATFAASLNTWYEIVVLVDVSGTTWRGRWWVDGVEQAAISKSSANTLASRTATQCWVGAHANNTKVFDFDDVYFADASTLYPRFPAYWNEAVADAATNNPTASQSASESVSGGNFDAGLAHASAQHGVGGYGGAFPYATGIDDDFDRATLGPDWTNSFNAGMTIFGNSYLQAVTGGSLDEGTFIGTYGPQVDAYLTLANVSGTAGDNTQIALIGAATGFGYYFQLVLGSPTQLTLFRFGGTSVQLGATDTSQTWASGDKIGLSIRSDGVRVYRQPAAGGAWIEVIFRNDTTYQYSDFTLRVGSDSTAMLYDDLVVATVGATIALEAIVDASPSTAMATASHSGSESVTTGDITDSGTVTATATLTGNEALTDTAQMAALAAALAAAERIADTATSAVVATMPGADALRDTQTGQGTATTTAAEAIRDSGTVAGTASFTDVEAIRDSGTVAGTASFTDVEAPAESGNNTGTGSHTGSEAIRDAGTVNATQSTPNPVEQDTDSGTNTGTASHTGSEAVADAGTVTGTATNTGVEAYAYTNVAVGSFTGSEALIDSGTNQGTASFAGVEALLDGGTNAATATLSGSDAVADVATSAATATQTGTERVSDSGTSAATTTNTGVEGSIYTNVGTGSFSGDERLSDSGASTGATTATGAEAMADSGTSTVAATHTGGEATADSGTNTATMGFATTTWAFEVSADSPSHWYSLDETSGTAFDDSAGSLDGSSANSPTLNQSPLISVGKAVRFTGSAIIQVTSPDAPLKNNGSFTIEFWFKPNTNPNSFPSIMGQGDQGTGQSWLIYKQVSPDRLVYRRQTGVGSTVFENTISASLSLGSVYHFVMTYDSTTHDIKTYLNGAPDTTRNFTFPTNGSTSALKLGRSDQPPDVTLDEVVFYDHVLSPTRANAHYYAGSGISVVSVEAISDQGTVAATAAHSGGEGIQDTVTGTVTVTGVESISDSGENDATAAQDGTGIASSADENDALATHTAFEAISDAGTSPSSATPIGTERVADTGAVAGTAAHSGTEGIAATVTGTGVATGVEAIKDSGTNAATATATASERTAQSGEGDQTASFSGSEAIRDSGESDATASTPNPVEQDRDSGTSASTSSFRASEAIVDRGELDATAVQTGTEGYVYVSAATASQSGAESISDQSAVSATATPDGTGTASSADENDATATHTGVEALTEPAATNAATASFTATQAPADTGNGDGTGAGAGSEAIKDSTESDATATQSGTLATTEVGTSAATGTASATEALADSTASVATATSAPTEEIADSNSSVGSAAPSGSEAISADGESDATASAVGADAISDSSLLVATVVTSGDETGTLADTNIAAATHSGSEAISDEGTNAATVSGTGDEVVPPQGGDNQATATHDGVEALADQGTNTGHAIHTGFKSKVRKGRIVSWDEHPASNVLSAVAVSAHAESHDEPGAHAVTGTAPAARAVTSTVARDGGVRSWDE